MKSGRPASRNSRRHSSIRSARSASFTPAIPPRDPDAVACRAHAADRPDRQPGVRPAGRRAGRGAAERAGAEVEAFAFSERDAAAGIRPGRDRRSPAATARSAAPLPRRPRAGVPLAVIATGTANDFAAALGLPATSARRARWRRGATRRRPMELGRAGGRPFVNVASVGLSPAAAEHAHGLKGRLGALAYPLGAIRAGATADAGQLPRRLRRRARFARRGLAGLGRLHGRVRRRSVARDRRERRQARPRRDRGGKPRAARQARLGAARRARRATAGRPRPALRAASSCGSTRTRA